MTRTIVLFILSLASFASCTETEPEVIPTHSTLLVYIVADNNLAGDATRTMHALAKGLQRSSMPGNLLIYADTLAGDPVLYRFIRQSNGSIERRIEKRYSEQNSVSKEVIKEIVAEAFALYPARDKILSLWSHGLNWFPVKFNLCGGYVPQRAPASWGDDYKQMIEIEELVEALPSGLHSILFDACYMSSVEVAYAFREKATYLFGASSEVLAEGIPYEKVLPALMGESPDLVRGAQIFFEHYSDPANTASGTVAVTRLSQMNTLADWMRETRTLLPYPMPISEVQSFDRGFCGNRYQFDFRHIIELYLPERLPALDTILTELVMYQAATQWYLKGYSGGYEIKRHCGLSGYIEQNNFPTLNQAYRQTSWYKATSH